MVREWNSVVGISEGDIVTVAAASGSAVERMQKLSTVACPQARTPEAPYVSITASISDQTSLFFSLTRHSSARPQASVC